TFNPGDFTRSTTFTPLSPGQTLLTAVTPSGFTAPANSASLTVTVTTPKMILPTGDTVGQNLEPLETILLGAAAPANGLTITLTSDGTSNLAFSNTSTGAGSSTLQVNVPAGQFSAQYYVYGLNSLGTVNVTATAPGYVTATGQVLLAPSGVVMDPNQGSATLTIHKAFGNASIPVSTAILNPNTFSYVQTQPLAGGQSVVVSLTNTNPTAGTLSPSVTITGGLDTANATFTPVTVGTQTVIGVSRPVGSWIQPSTQASVVVSVVN